MRQQKPQPGTTNRRKAIQLLLFYYPDSKGMTLRQIHNALVWHNHKCSRHAIRNDLRKMGIEKQTNGCYPRINEMCRAEASWDLANPGVTSSTQLFPVSALVGDDIK